MTCPACEGEYLRTLPCGADDAYIERHGWPKGELCDIHRPVLGVCDDCRATIKSRNPDRWEREYRPITHQAPSGELCPAWCFARILDIPVVMA